jgi:hypothetical protein
MRSVARRTSTTRSLAARLRQRGDGRTAFDDATGEASGRGDPRSAAGIRPFLLSNSHTGGRMQENLNG